MDKKYRLFKKDPSFNADLALTQLKIYNIVGSFYLSEIVKHMTHCTKIIDPHPNLNQLSVGTFMLPTLGICITFTFCNTDKRYSNDFLYLTALSGESQKQILKIISHGNN